MWIGGVLGGKHLTDLGLTGLVVLSLSMSSSLWLHGPQHTRLPCSSPSPGVCSNSCPLSQWFHPTISSSVSSFSHPQTLSALQSFPMSQFFVSGGQSIGTSASALDLPMNIQGWFPFGWSGLISLQSKGLSRVFSSTTVWQHQFFGVSFTKAPIPFMGDPPSWLNHFPKAPPPNTSILGVSILTYESGGMHSVHCSGSSSSEEETSLRTAAMLAASWFMLRTQAVNRGTFTAWSLTICQVPQY